MNIKEKQEISEKTCVEKFIYYYNKESGFNYKNIIKNPNQDEIDFFVKDDENNILNIQVTKIFRDFEKGLGEMISCNRKNNVSVEDVDNHFVKDGLNGVRKMNDIISEIESCIYKKLENYKKQDKDISDIVLLLDSKLLIPKINLPDKIIRGNLIIELPLNINNYNFIYENNNYKFKEIYIVCSDYIKKIN